MGFYLIVIACLYDVACSYAMMVFQKQKPPRKWGDWPYSKSRLALRLNKVREKSKYLGPLRIDRFHFIGFISSLAIFVISCVALVIDMVSNEVIHLILGDLAIALIAVCAFLAPILYEFFLVIWWSITDKDSSRNSQMKKLKKIKKRNREK